MIALTSAELTWERGFSGINEKRLKNHRLLSEDSLLKESETLQGGNAQSQQRELLGSYLTSPLSFLCVLEMK